MLNTLVLSILAVTSPAQFDVTYKGSKVGTASVTQKLTEGGSKTVMMSVEIKIQGKITKVRSENSYDATGLPMRKFVQTTGPGPRDRKTTIVTFSTEGAHVVTEFGGSRKQETVTLLETAPRANPSEFWFVKVQPKVGTQVRTYLFDIDSNSWQVNTITYKGKVTHKKMAGHLIESERYTAVVDDAGLPIAVEFGAMMLERRKSD